MESILEKFDLSGELSGAGAGSWQKCHGGEILAGAGFGSGIYVTPCICEAGADFSIVREETFAPLTGRARCPWRRGSSFKYQMSDNRRQRSDAGGQSNSGFYYLSSVLCPLSSEM